MAYINHVLLLYNSYNNGMTMCCVTVIGTDSYELPSETDKQTPQRTADEPVAMTSATSTLLMSTQSDNDELSALRKVSGK